ncbi:phosphate signaling complex protein PhoU [Azospirillum sp. TSO22-1]|uniref:phosphate signaling complex protein PhoU n=1 Tax=Azospirillum sp. TSO22-1 TaxID=716789 RepID=UPI001FFF93DA|nr:phosphate signaling complex protein PhoU [Azospirillum sp. TSO22-1]
MFHTFDQELAELRKTIETMGRLVESQFAGAMTAITTGDAELAATVIAGDPEVDRLELQVESMAVRLLALRQPMGGDLREIVAAFRISSDLERMGDFARTIAKRAMTVSALPVPPPAVPSLGWMGDSVLGMIRDMVTAHATRDVELATAVRNRDGEVDHAYTALFRELLTYMMESPQQITGCTHLLFAAKAIERVGDHATNVAENTCFLVKGKLPSDERPKDDHTSEVT